MRASLAATIRYNREAVRYRLVIFDFDGTLADSAAWMRRALDDVAERYGFRQITDAEVLELRGKDTREILDHLEVPTWKLPFIARHMRKRMAAEAHAIRLFPGVHELLAQLSARGVELAVVSSNAEDNVRTILGEESAARIRVFECGAGLFGKRPKFRRVLRATGVAADEALAIGDEVRDLEAAAAEGIATGAVSWGYATPARLRAHEPEVMFTTMDEMRRVLVGAG